MMALKGNQSPIARSPAGRGPPHMSRDKDGFHGMKSLADVRLYDGCGYW